MKKILSGLAIIVAVAACTKHKSNADATPAAISNQTPKTESMKNLISIVEIPTTDFARAVKFYQTVLDIRIEEVDMAGTKMGVMPSDGKTVNVVLVNGPDYKPTTDGALLYLNAGEDLQPMLHKIEQNGGQVMVPKTEISPEMGFFALFIDTEGNKLGLHSVK